MTGPHACWNFFFVDRNKLAGGASTDNSGTFLVSYAPILASLLTFAPALDSTQGLPSRYTDEDLQKTTKLILESFV